jgi:hypothetical protein
MHPYRPPIGIQRQRTANYERPQRRVARRIDREHEREGERRDRLGLRLREPAEQHAVVSLAEQLGRNGAARPELVKSTIKCADSAIRRPIHGDTMPEANNPQVKLPNRMTSLVRSSSRIAGPSTAIA